MPIAVAYRLAQDWAKWFKRALFIVQVTPTHYRIATTVSAKDRVIARFEAA